MHPDHTHFPSFPGPLSTLRTFPSSPKWKVYQVQSLLPIYSLEPGQTTSCQLLKDNRVFSHSQYPSDVINCEELQFNIPTTVLRDFFNGFLSRLFLFGGLVGGGGEGCGRSLLCLSFLTMNLQSSVLLQKKLSCHLQVVVAHIMDFHIVFGDGMDHRHQHGLQEQHNPGISAWPPEVAQTVDITMTPGSRTDHRHQHSFKQQHRSLMPTWLLAAE